MSQQKQELSTLLHVQKGEGTWSQLAERMGNVISKSLLADMAAGPPRWDHVSLEKRNIIRHHFGLPLEVEPVEVLPCPTCGLVHSLDDCHGKHGELRIVTPRPQKPKPVALMAQAALAEAISGRVEYDPIIPEWLDDYIMAAQT